MDKLEMNESIKTIKGIKRKEKMMEENLDSAFINEARIGKTKEVKVLQGNYGYGWEDLLEYELADFNGDLLAMNKEIRQDLKDYRENETNASHRVITRRVARELKEDLEREFTIFFDREGFEYGSYGAVRIKATNEDEAEEKFYANNKDGKIHITSIRPTENEDIRKGIRLMEEYKNPLKNVKNESLKNNAQDYAINFRNDYEGFRGKIFIKANSAIEALKDFSKDVALKGWGIRNTTIISVSPNDGNMRLYGSLYDLIKSTNGSIATSDNDEKINPFGKVLFSNGKFRICERILYGRANGYYLLDNKNDIVGSYETFEEAKQDLAEINKKLKFNDEEHSIYVKAKNENYENKIRPVNDEAQEAVDPSYAQALRDRKKFNKITDKKVSADLDNVLNKKFTLDNVKKYTLDESLFESVNKD